jgi:transposase-like protein
MLDTSDNAQCTFCGHTPLVYQKGIEPYTVESFICPECDSTFPVEYEIEIEFEE